MIKFFKGLWGAASRWWRVDPLPVVKVGKLYVDPVDDLTVAEKAGEVVMNVKTGKFFISTRASTAPALAAHGSRWKLLDNVHLWKGTEV